MKKAIIIFPHQLFEENPALVKGAEVFLVEEYLFFRQYKFHKQKLVFHRASMKFYESYLNEKGYKVNYIESGSGFSDVRNLIAKIGKEKFTEVNYCDVADNWLRKRVETACAEHGLKGAEYDSPMFLNTRQYNEEYFKGRKQYFQTDFYVSQRKKYGILLEEGNKPYGGKWSYDAENRKKYPKNKIPPKIKNFEENEFTREAREYVQKNFAENYGDINGGITFPVTFEDSRKWFKEFLNERFEEFGIYEDAIVEKENLLNHSGISPMLNAGLITPEYLVKETVKFFEKKNIPLNSVEGFIRQIIGWREFIRAVYELKGTEERTRNFWKFKRRMPESFWSGTTGIEPVDAVIKKVLRTGYCHHIERLMVLGNFMALCEFHPDDVYKWFMEMFIDAYDWVMVPNVYGMSQFADGGIMSTKPYISGSNYLMKMSDFRKGEWQEVWDALFWNFMNNHREFFQKNPRMGMLIKTFDKMPNEKREKLIITADTFLKTL